MLLHTTTTAAILCSLSLLQPTSAAPQGIGYAGALDGPSVTNDCKCQCSNRIYMDTLGGVQGNCRSTINGKKWCYIKGDALIHCPQEDIQYEAVSQLPYSFQACATPAADSPICTGESGKAVSVLTIGSINGTITLTQENEQTEVRIKGQISGLKPNGLHGFHIHMLGDISGGCKSTGGHFNPDKQRHGSPNDLVRHVGDLGNIQAGPDGVADFDFTDNQVTLFGRDSVLGRAFVVHEGQDDLGQGGDEGSLKTGNAGGRKGCGVIGIAN